MGQRVTWIIVILVLLVAVAGGGFYLGTRYQSAQAAALAADRAQFFAQRSGDQGGAFFGQNGQGGAGGANRGGARGAVDSVNGDTVVINTPQGPVTAHLSGTTRITKSVAGTSDDIKTGETIVVTGERNADGSINAINIMIQPAPIATPTPQ